LIHFYKRIDIAFSPYFLLLSSQAKEVFKNKKTRLI